LLELGFYGKNRPCKQCTKDYLKKNKKKVKKWSKKWRDSNWRKIKDLRLRHTYGITLDDFDQMSLNQNYKCKICKSSKELHVNLCHKNGKVRGLLCNTCNRAICLLKDSVDTLTNAIEYLNDAHTVIEN